MRTILVALVGLAMACSSGPTYYVTDFTVTTFCNDGTLEEHEVKQNGACLAEGAHHKMCDEFKADALEIYARCRPTVYCLATQVKTECVP